jgi:TolB-like protein/class 3 adenylate cyclase
VSATGQNLGVAGKAAGGRKLIAVVYADMVGYSRLIGLDDVGTLERLRALRSELIDPAIHEYGGRVVQTGGDSLLVAFDSIDGAVRCAVKVQQQVPVYDDDQPPDRRIRFRVGIDMGDAIPDGTDLHGDAVNVAARLEGECPAGEICVSRAVRDHVHGRLDLRFAPIGELTLKNMPRPVEAFVLRLNGGAEGQVSNQSVVVKEWPTPLWRFRAGLVGTAAVLLVCILIVTGWWLTHGGTDIVKTPDVAATSGPTQAAVLSATQPANPTNTRPSKTPELSVVVLPFTNLGGVDDDTVDAIAEDVTTDLARLHDLLVIARNSAFVYKGKAIDVKRVGEELGVRYAVEGSVRNAGGPLRVTVQLISTETGAHIWAEPFDVRRDGIGYGVDDIVRQIAFALSAGIVNSEAARSARERPSNPNVADILLRARSIYNKPVTPQRQAELVPLYQRAIELDPTSATALAGLAEALLDSIRAFSDDPTAPEKIHRAEELLQRAELLRPDMWRVMLVRVGLLGWQDRCQDVIPAAQRAADAHPNLTGPHLWMGICLLRMGRAAEAIPALEQSIRRNPRNPNIFGRYRLFGYATLFLGRYDEAVQWFERALAANPSDNAQARSSDYASIAAAQALEGHIDAARLSAAEATRLAPTLTARSYLPFNIKNPVAVGQVARMRDGMRLAGIRDHADEEVDLGLPSDDALRTNYEAPTPTTVPGAQSIRTQDLVKLLEQRKPLVIDTINWGQSIPGAVGLWGAGIGGSLSDEYQDRLGRKMRQLTRGDRTLPIVAMGFNSERYQGRNLALRLVALGYTNVYWYRGGREAWEVAGLPETDFDVQDW